jgi:starvation-inducible DNA-binding protein
MDELKIAIRVLLANTYVLYFKIHSFHWNIEGIHFTQYHDFLGNVYQDVYGSIDPIAEFLRKLDDYAPKSLDEMFKYKTLNEETTQTDDIRAIMLKLLADNEEVIASLNKVFALATAANKQGIANFVADRIDAHEKHSWFLRASAKKIG